MMLVRRMVFGLMLGLLLAGCSAEPDGAAEAVFVIQACEDQQFRVLTRDSDVIAEAEGLVGEGEERIVNGELRRGDGGFNMPYAWHLDPETVEFTDAATEVCDGCPERIGENLDYWVDTVGRFCPFSTEVVERVR